MKLPDLSRYELKKSLSIWRGWVLGVKRKEREPPLKKEGGLTGLSQRRKRTVLGQGASEKKVHRINLGKNSYRPIPNPVLPGLSSRCPARWSGCFYGLDRILYSNNSYSRILMGRLFSIGPFYWIRVLGKTWCPPFMPRCGNWEQPRLIK